MDFVKIIRDVLVVLILVFIAFRVNEIKNHNGGSVWIEGGTVKVEASPRQAFPIWVSLR